MVKLHHDPGAEGDRDVAVKLLRERLKEFESARWTSSGLGHVRL